ncbi:hypothetical protein PBI_GAIA_15 [Mycobacterium phage Gaia]|uniref:Uncharacterized protein n=1 Tax=Mycobacterium phage Gaia TaxID=1486472 RepID=A0A068F8K8_9CAUD|nr:hypothetical protein VC46_gp015 [Mycobacterium phage Gaia]AID58835.1 hypothetical protein PBI_GAIA_15 [Mycobacterium phage Gaia]AYQ99958.1 DNA binding protein [Mycobacterium phage Nebkiss]
MRNAKCKQCGSTRVTWHQAKSGKWVLMNLSQEYDNGQAYLRGPHYKTCPGETPEQVNQRITDRNEAYVARALELAAQGLSADEAIAQAAKEINRLDDQDAD